jgi:hypothetical protein
MTAPGTKGRRWSQRVTETSNALDLEAGVFRLDDPRAIARSLKRSAERSRRRKTDAFRSAMSMLTFYVNRAGRHLPPTRRAVLEAAKRELRAVFGRARLESHMPKGALRHDRTRQSRRPHRPHRAAARAG